MQDLLAYLSHRRLNLKVIYLSFAIKVVNAKSILNILAIGAKKGDEITLKIAGEDEKEALDTLVKLLEGLNE